MELRIYDVAGHQVRRLLDSTLEPGRHRMEWDGLDASGKHVPSGVYLYRMMSADYSATRRMVVLK